ncbi:uncharacterized protein LOC110828708 isoform X1 [Zootermopsis nevadensis]|uniref:uncharacterized protein LOC110828708 isoform X1 n=1 Tax=Zootermopsis nevadensis TaxID=136037 RepID=UPI000B8EA87D|nr:uncharacterized protein LOC110828708 isoform X1 [Zootermopsis nevadensis]
MGLLLSVLVVCVGVLEVLACVRHFQDGYLPLWTPHCAVTSGYTASYERWRKKPSDNFEFGTFDDVCDTLNRTENQSLDTSSNIQNGFTVKRFENADKNNYSSTYEESGSDSGNGLSSSVDEHKNEVLCYEKQPNILASSLDNDESEVNVINNVGKNAISHIPHEEYDRRSQEAFADEFTSGLQSEIHPVNIGARYEVLISETQTQSPGPRLSDCVLEETFSSDAGIEKYPLSLKDTDSQQNEIPILNTDDESHTSSLGSVNEQSFEGDSPNDFLGVKYPTRILETESDLEDLLSDLYSSEISDRKSTVEPGSEVPVQEGGTNIPLSEFITDKCSSALTVLDQFPATGCQTQILLSGRAVDSTVNHEGEIPSTRSEINNISSYLEIQDDKSILGVVAGKPSRAIEEDFDKHQYDAVTSGQDESAVPEQSNQNLLVPNSVSESTSIATVTPNSQHSPSLSSDVIDSEGTEVVNENSFRSPELRNVQEELPASNFHVGSETFLCAENAGRDVGSDVSRGGIEALNSQVERSVHTFGTESTTDFKQENLQNVTFEDHRISETSLDPEGGGPSSPDFEDYKQISITNDDAQQDVSGSHLDSQMTLTDFATSLDERARRQDDSGLPTSGSLTGHDVLDSNIRSSSFTSVTPLTIDTSGQSSMSRSPLTIDTSLETSASVTPLPTDHQPSLSPIKFPSAPRKSKADISWPIFFPGTPVIKRPSVSFATPESVFANEDEELLRQFVEETSSRSSCIKMPADTSTSTKSETTPNASEGRISESAESPESDDLLDEQPVSIIFRDKSPSNIASGNDFSRKELKLQRRKGYKQKRYSSATEIRAQDEETEDTSFSENNPKLIRASSVKEPKKLYRKPARSSSFEDVVSCDSEAEGNWDAFGAEPRDEMTDVSVAEEEEAVAGETTGKGDVAECPRIRTERNPPKLNESKTPKDDTTQRQGDTDEGMRDDNDDDLSVSEEQSSSQQKSAPKEAFWLIFSGEYTKAMSKDWHSGHFCCWQCDESLTGQRYVLRDDHPYCIKCYESVFANACEECSKTIGIDSKDLSYKDKHWHEACFLCNKCRVSLVDKQFGSKADKIYCGNCYDAQFASRCDGCGEIFRAGTKKMEYKTRQWHEKCFCCCVCKTAIGTKSFIPREQEIYCATCYEEKFATRCVKCNKIITSGGVTYKNEPWHRECFTCTHCNTSLAGQRFTSRDEKPYCAECFGELFAKRCTACSKPITGIGGTRFISFEDRHWHNDCFICATCKTSLVGRGFITDADDIICPECAKQKLM